MGCIWRKDNGFRLLWRMNGMGKQYKPGTRAAIAIGNKV